MADITCCPKCGCEDAEVIERVVPKRTYTYYNLAYRTVDRSAHIESFETRPNKRVRCIDCGCYLGSYDEIIAGREWESE